MMRVETARAAAPFSSASLSLAGLLDMQVAMQPLRTFLVAPDGRHWSFQEVEAAAGHLGWLMAQVDVKAGDCVALLAPSGPRAAVSLIGLLRAGLKPLILSPLSPFADLAAAAARHQPTAVIAEDPADGPGLVETATRLAAASDSIRFVLGVAPSLPRGVVDLGARLESARSGVDAPREERATEADALIIADAGGDATIAIEPLLSSAIQISGAVGLRSADRLVCPLPLTDIAALSAGLFAGLFTGAEVAALEAPDAGALVQSFDTTRALHAVWPATLSPLLADLAGGTPLRSLIRRKRVIDEAGGFHDDLLVDHLVDIAQDAQGELIVETVDTVAADTLRRRRG